MGLDHRPVRAVVRGHHRVPHRAEDGTVDRRRDHKVLLPPARAEQERRGDGDRDAREVVGVAKGAKTAEGVRRVTQSGGRPEQIFRRND